MIAFGAFLLIVGITAFVLLIPILEKLDKYTIEQQIDMLFWSLIFIVLTFIPTGIVILNYYPDNTVEMEQH